MAFRLQICLPDFSCPSPGFGAKEVAAGGGQHADHTPTLSVHPSLTEKS